MISYRWLRVFALVLLQSVQAPTRARAQAVAQLKASEGVVEILRAGRWRRARPGSEITLLDRVRTGPGALAKIEFFDGDLDRGTQPTTIDLVPQSEISIAHFDMRRTSTGERQGFIELLGGYLRALTKGWALGSIFAVKAGRTVCGIRGSIAEIGFDPLTGKVVFQSLDGKMFTFQVPGVTLPEDYASMTVVQKQAVMRTFTVRAVAKALDYGRQLREVPDATLDGAAPLEIGSAEYGEVTGSANFRRQPVSPALLAQIKATPVHQAAWWSSGAPGVPGAGGPPGPGPPRPGLPRPPGFQDLIQQIETELVGSGVLNGPVSDQ